MQLSESVEEKIAKFAETLLAGMDLELVEVQFRMESHGWVLRVFIDGPEGINIDDCSGVSRELSDFLDVEDLIEQAYNLEVSSPGLTRPLKKIDDYKRFLGSKARVKLREALDGQKVVIGEISRVENNIIGIHTEDGHKFEVEFDNIRKARLSL